MPLPMLYTKEEATGICVPYGAADALWHSDQVDSTGHEAYVQIAIMSEVQHKASFTQLAPLVHDSVLGWMSKTVAVAEQIPDGQL